MWLMKSGKGFLPADDEAEAMHARMTPGECAEFHALRPRSIQWNRLYWKTCRTIGQNQDPPRDEDSIDAELRVLAGHFDVLKMGGYEVRVPKRIAFDRLTADEWAAYWLRAEAAIADRFGAEYLTEAD